MSGCQRCLVCGCLAVGDVLCADVISRRVTRPTIVGTTWLDEMCESTKAPKAMR